MSVSATADILSSTCGVGLFYDFESDGYCCEYDDLKTNRNPGGCDWAIAGFVKNEVCKEAYTILRSRFKLIYQSPVRRNTRSGRKFFFCVYDTRSKP